MATCMRNVSFTKFLRNQGFPVCKKSPWVQCHRRTETTSTVVDQQTTGFAALSEVRDDKPVDKIIFPKRKKRDELTVLKCLAATVTRDPTAPHYMYMDDPYLIPHTDREKKSFGASKMSGRKAARYIMDICPKPFMTDMFFESPSVPLIKDFMPKILKYKQHEVCEEALKERIDFRKVTDAIDMYKEIKNQGLSLSEETMLSLLHLLCVFNNKDPEPEEYAEELRFNKGFKPVSEHKFNKTWKNNGPAEEVFNDLPNKTPEAYCSLIKGMARHLESEKALALYNEMLDNNMPIDVGTFNEIIIMYKSLIGDQRWDSVKQVLQTMKERRVMPNNQTFLNVLNFLRSRLRVLREKEVFKVLNEMKALNMDLTLGICDLALRIVTQADDNVDHPILEELLDYLENKTLEVVSVEDTGFFIGAMNVCSRRQDVKLAHRVDALLNTKDHYKFMLDSEAENAYSQKLFMLVCQFETIDKIMEVYERLVPNLWTPRYTGFLELFNAIELQNGYSYIPPIWADMTIYNYLVPELLTPLFEILSQEKHDTQLEEKFMTIVDNLLQRWENDHTYDEKYPLRLSGQIMGYLITLCLNGSRFDLAWKALEVYVTGYFTDPPKSQISKESMQMLKDECVKRGETVKAKQCEDLMEKINFERKRKETQKTEKDLPVTKNTRLQLIYNQQDV